MARYEDLAQKMAAVCPGMRLARATRALAGADGATIGDLAEALLLDRTTLTRNLRPLQKAGYLSITRSPKDARVQIVSLTQQGQKTIEAIYPLWQRAYGQIRDALGPRALAELNDRLHQATAAVLAAHLEH